MIKFDRLFQILKERGISQYHLYTYKGISRSQIQRLKTGNVNVNTLNNILNVLEDCTLDDICEFTPDKTGKEDEE
ncbi:helix-turn-helix transcriptional regulator [uncultured Acetatifactor sp.]|jgi:putative transcriptional regulator|uniref:helix-turn-helix domain-containing protein n=1 Tax=uncultured Acetatifactor sp. TaxID=1671927 RepID=UPI00262BB9A4|nr:helix-turn-helix transcriptional regulator [uncultured Acetatifactor sp.]MCI8696356.1 helix-turn-helix transcriptional regulator [Lachnospiraceae bacterium]MCI9573796.1 helix-turn-helix transcriptional regulator [Lachnospiraceae bacterium]